MNQQCAVISKTKLRKKVKDMSVADLQNYLHETAFTDEEKIRLIAFEKIVRNLNRVDEAIEIMRTND